MGSRPLSGADAGDPGWPAELNGVFERAITCEYASLTPSGRPVTVPSTPYRGSGTLDISTGLSYPAKAERARANPKVALLFADTIGVDAGPVVLVQGLAAVRDADLQANTDRYVRLASEKLPEATKGQPRFLLRRMTFYYARIWVEVSPLRILWWENRALGAPPREWRADPSLPEPASDPAPAGDRPAAWLEPPSDWRTVAARALGELPLADLTYVAEDGFPVCIPVRAGALVADEVPLSFGPGAPPLSAGRACLTVHGHDPAFTSQENHTLVGTLAPSEAGAARLHVERALADWSLTGSRARIALGFLRKGRTLAPRLEREAARRGQQVPAVRFP